MYKIGLHDETFSVDYSERHINQFREHFEFKDFDTASHYYKNLVANGGLKREAAGENAMAAQANNEAVAPESELV